MYIYIYNKRIILLNLKFQNGGIGFFCFLSINMNFISKRKKNYFYVY